MQSGGGGSAYAYAPRRIGAFAGDAPSLSFGGFQEWLRHSAFPLDQALFLLPGSGAHAGLPGNYLYGSILQTCADEAAGGWAILVHDVENGTASCELDNRAEAAAKFQDVAASAPFLLVELAELGFRLN